MKIYGEVINGKEVVIECTASELRELIKVEEKEIKTVPVEKDPKKEAFKDAIKAAVEERKKKYTDLDIVRMKDEQGLAMKEISEKTGIPYSSCWKMYHRVSR